MSINWLAVMTAGLWPPGYAFLVIPLLFRGTQSRGYQYSIWALQAAVSVLVQLSFRDWSGVVAGLVSLIAALAFWWWKRRGRRAVQQLGAKSRQLRDALVRKARDVARPRQVLRPVPGGVR